MSEAEQQAEGAAQGAGAAQAEEPALLGGVAAAEAGLKAVVVGHLGFALILGLLIAVLSSLRAWEGPQAEPFLPTFCGLSAGLGLLLGLGTGLQLRIEAARRLDLALLPLVALALTAAALSILPEQGPRALLVAGLLWIKVRFVWGALRAPSIRASFALGRAPEGAATWLELWLELGGMSLAVLGLAAFGGLLTLFLWIRGVLYPESLDSGFQALGTFVGAGISAGLTLLALGWSWTTLRARSRGGGEDESGTREACS